MDPDILFMESFRLALSDVVKHQRQLSIQMYDITFCGF